VWYLFTDVSAQLLGPIFKVEESEPERKQQPPVAGFPSVKNYHTTSRNIAKERKSHFWPRIARGGKKWPRLRMFHLL
jgi:hypothetical protein